MIIENKDERLLVCQRDECGIVSCLQCKKVSRCAFEELGGKLMWVRRRIICRRLAPRWMPTRRLTGCISCVLVPGGAVDEELMV